MQNTEPQSHHKDHINALGKAYTGGPKGVGDPNDESLRHVESYVVVTQMVKDRAHLVKCKDLVQNWGECMEDNGYSSILTCRKQLSAMNDCLKFWYTNPEFRKECEHIYIEKRKKFRETGVIEKDEKVPYFISRKKYNPKFPEMYDPTRAFPNTSNETKDST